MAFPRSALACAVVLLTACGSPSFTAASGDAGDGDAAANADVLDAGPPLACPGAPNGSCELGKVCCITKSGGSSFVASCASGASCTTVGTGGQADELHCTSSSQCGSITPVCCITKVSGTFIAKCAAQCGGGAVVCQPGASACTPSQGTCSTGGNGDWNLPPDLGTCTK
jgi:hypothetical protein